MNPRRVVPALVVLALALGVTGLVLLIRGSGDGDDERTAARSSTTTSTTQAPTTTTGSFTTTPTSPPPAPPSTVTPGTVVVATTEPPDVREEPPTAAGPSDTAGSDPAPTTSPPTTSPRTTNPPTTAAPESAADDPFETVVYSPDGAPERKGDLLVPEVHGSTAIVLVHGGDGTNGNRRQLRGWAEGYAEAGYPTLSISYFKYQESTEPPVFPVPERNVKAAVQYLREHADDLEIDPDRILVQGFGAGAGLGSIAYVTGEDPAFAGVGLYDDTSDVVNGFIGFYGDYEGTRADPEQYCGGPPDSTDSEVEACYDLSDAVSRAADATGPALLVHGDEDETIPYETTEAFGDALTDADIEALVVMVEGADHNFDRSRRALTPEGEAMLAQIVDWLALTFPEPDDDSDATATTATP